MHIRTYASYVFVFLALLSLQGCVVWDFIDVRWQNATGYFNTYYNAERTFDEAVEEINARRESKNIDPNQVSVSLESAMPEGLGDEEREQMRRDIMMSESGVPSNALVKLDKVIEKCSRILINYPQSKWVDNSLMLIGKSYYYKSEALRAERKFQELLDKYPESDLVPEAILWLGKSYVRLEKFDVAETMLNKAIEAAIEEEEADVASAGYFELGKMYLLIGDRATAVSKYEKATEFAADRDQRIEAQLALAREYEKLGEKEQAADAYRHIFTLDPSSELEFIAEINYAKLTRESGDLDEASNTLINMLENPQYLDYDGKIQLEIAHLYYAYHKHYVGLDDSLSVDAFRAAMEQYTFVDTTFKGVPETADALYAKGRIYEEDIQDYDNAFDNYSGAKLAFPGTESAKLSNKKAKIFGEYRKLRNQMVMKDSTLFFVLNPDTLRIRDSLQVITDSLDRERRKEEGVDDANLSEEERMAERFRRRRPHGRNTGRVNPWERELERQAEAMAAGMKNAKMALIASGPEYRRVDLESTDPDSLRTVIAELYMEMGWIMFDQIHRIDSARYYYQKALDNHLEDRLRPQAYYTMAAFERKAGNEETAVALEDRLMQEFPASGFAHSIMQVRGLPLPMDSTAIARGAYDAAAKELEHGSRERGIAMMKDVMNNFPDSDQALRAQLAIAMLYEEYKGEEALAMYREMVDKHPDSPYSKRGKEILAALENAKVRETKRKMEAEQEAERQRKAEEERKRVEQRYRNPLLDEELRVMRDSVRAEEEEIDPSLDEDFPLRLPGSEPPKKNEETEKPVDEGVRRNPDSIDPSKHLKGDTLRRLTPPIPTERK